MKTSQMNEFIRNQKVGWVVGASPPSERNSFAELSADAGGNYGQRLEEGFTIMGLSADDDGGES